MRRGLVLGKFMPLHLGHLALIDYARERCEHLTVLLCAQDAIEPIPGALRRDWLEAELRYRTGTELVFKDVVLPATSESSREISILWGKWIQETLPPFDFFCSSEPYGEYLAEYLGIQHIPFDPERGKIGVSGTDIRNFPQKYWDYLARPAKPYFLGRVAILGTESTGKSTLAAQLAANFGTVFVPEQARGIIPDSQKFVWEDLFTVAEAQAHAIQDSAHFASRLLFSDTDLRTTQIYGQHFFGQLPDFSQIISGIPPFHLTLLLDNDAPFVQDGTRLAQQDRDQLHQTYLKIVPPDGKIVHLISGDWEARFRQAVGIIQRHFSLG